MRIVVKNTRTRRLSPYYLQIRPLLLSTTSVLAAVMLSACQSNPTSSTLATTSAINSTTGLNAHINAARQSNNDTLNAKTTLAQALEQQRARHYIYQMDIKATNIDRRNALASATAQQLAMSDTPNTHCEHIHDEAYSQLFVEASAMTLEVDNDLFTSRREAIKEEYIDCHTKEMAWQKAQWQNYDYEEDAIVDDALSSSIDEQLTLLEEQEAAIDNEAFNEAIAKEDFYGISTTDIIRLETALDDETSVFLPNYDHVHTELDARKAKLLDAYLLSPTSINVEGVYRPYTGKVSIMPTFAYQGRNHTNISNHFIYLDASDGAVYFWADTFAYIMSQYLDNELGLSMKDKWIKLDLNDGSLPEGFGRTLIESHFAAKDREHDYISNDDYRYLTFNQAATLQPSPTPAHISTLTKTPIIVERRIDEATLKDAKELYFSTLYERITEAYPELMNSEQSAEVEMATAEDSDFNGTDFSNSNSNNNSNSYSSDNDESNDESNGMFLVTENADRDREAANAERATAVAAARSYMLKVEESMTPELGVGTEPVNETPLITSRNMVTTLLGLFKNMQQADDNQSEVAKLIEEINREPVAQPNNPNVDYASIDLLESDTLAAENNWIWRDLYGMNNRHQIQWHLSQRQLPNDTGAIASTDKEDILRGIRLETLTHYKGATPITPMFAVLPNNVSLPNADNSIDVKEYAADLTERYKEGEGTPMGEMLFDLILKRY